MALSSQVSDHPSGNDTSDTRTSDTRTSDTYPAGKVEVQGASTDQRSGGARPVWQSVLIGAAALFLGLGLLGAIWIFARPLALLILGVTIAAALAPLVHWAANIMPRVVALVLVYVVLFALIGGLIWSILPSFSGEALGFTQHLPQLFEQGQQWLNERLSVDMSTIVGSLQSSFTNVAASIADLPLQFSSALLDTILVIFLSVYALVAAPKFRGFIVSLFPDARRKQAEDILLGMGTAMGGYVRGVFFSGLIVAILTYVGLLLIGVEFPLVLGVIAGVFEVVPVVGSLTAGALIVVVALFQSTNTALITLIFVIIVQQTESNVIFPLIMGQETEASPLLNLFAFFAGSAVGGILGALVAVPLAAALRVFVLRVVAPAVRRWFGVTDAAAQRADGT